MTPCTTCGQCSSCTLCSSGAIVWCTTTHSLWCNIQIVYVQNILCADIVYPLWYIKEINICIKSCFFSFPVSFRFFLDGIHVCRIRYPPILHSAHIIGGPIAFPLILPSAHIIGDPIAFPPILHSSHIIGDPIAFPLILHSAHIIGGPIAFTLIPWTWPLCDLYGPIKVMRLSMCSAT